MNGLQALESLVKALEAGGYNAAPSTLVQGSALQMEDLSPVMENVTFDDKHIKLQKLLKVDGCKSNLSQFDRQLSYGGFGGSAQLEGNIGQENTGDYVRITVPMCYYVDVRRTTLVAQMVATVDGVKAQEREASNSAKKIAGDIEFDLFRGCADFSNAGVYDGNQLAVPSLMANMRGVDLQVRQSDSQLNSHDLMFAEFGSDDSVVIAGGGPMTQTNIEDAQTRSAMNMGNADMLLVDPKVLSGYNKLTFNLQRIILAGSPQEASGASLKDQWTSQGTVKIEQSRFLSAKTKPQVPRYNAPPAPTIAVASVTVGGVVTTFTSGQVYNYIVTSGNEVGESVPTAATAVTVSSTGDELQVTITPPGSGTVRWFNVYRTVASGAATATKYIGRVVLASTSTTIFYDLNNKLPGFVTGFLVEGDTMDIAELSPFSRVKMAVTDLSTPEVSARFCTLRVKQPRKNVLIDNLQG